MEAVEDTMLEAAIGWLADTILANLPAGGKLDSWIRQAGLGNDISMLKSEVEAVEMVVSAVQGRAAGNKPLARSLAAVKELLYDADDVVDELDCYRLQQHQLQPETLLLTDGTQQTVENSRENTDDVQGSGNNRLRSEVWDQFEITAFLEQTGGPSPSRARCKRCQTELMCGTKNGTSVLRKHLITKGCSNKRGTTAPSSSTAGATTIPTHVAAGNLSSRKKMRIDQDSTHITAANPNGWNKGAFSERIQDITSQLQARREAITGLLKILGPDSGVASSNHCQSTISDPRRRTSSLLQGKVYGRAQERASIKKLIKKHKSTAGVTVLPIVGIGGVGKTALAQLVYNDPALESQFDHKIWIWMSNNFDEIRLTREMLDCISQKTHDGICSFPKLQETLKGCIKSKRVLLILDDVWDDMDHCRWNQLLAPFKSDNAKGNMIIVTTRKPSVAESRGTTGPINLGGLEKDHFWQLFKSCAFGDVNYEAQASLSDLGQEIAQKLKGNPLAAQTVGALLRQHLTVDHWSNILKTEAWKSLQHTGGIMSSLKLSYDELPYPVQQCWSYCSIFLYGDKFLAEELVHLWISQGFVKRDHSSKSLEEIGRYYLTYLVNLGLFEQVERYILPFKGVTKTGYAMCGLMHDLARLVSKTECAALDGLQCNDILPTVHHLSIVTSSIYQRNCETADIPRNEKFEFFMQNIVASVRKLRTLVLIGEYDSFFFKAFQDVFEKAHNLRLLQISATSADFNSFMCNLVNPTRLRYLKLQDAHTEQKALPHVMSKFFHLEVLDVDLFMSLHTVHLEDFGGWIILPSLEMLSFLKRLKLSNMQRVREVSVPSLEELVLDRMPDLQRCSCTSVGDMKSSLRVLEIQSCPALEVFDLFQKGQNYKIECKSWFPNLRKLIMRDCPHLQVQTPLPPSAIFSELSINSTTMTMEGSSMGTFKISGNRIWGLPSGETMALDDKILSFHNLKDIKYLEISAYLISISFKCLSQLISLKSLKIGSYMEIFSSDDVPEQTCEDMITALPALESLNVRGYGITEKWLSLMLRHSCTMLEDLEISDCKSLVTLEGMQSLRTLRSLVLVDNYRLKSVQLNSCTVLERLEISSCRSLVTVEGLRSLVDLKHLALNSLTTLKSYEPTEGIPSHSYELFPALERLEIDDLSPLCTSFCKGLTYLRSLKLTELDATRLPDEQERALVLLRSLHELQFEYCRHLVDLPAGLRGLPSLKTLAIIWCDRISGLPKEGLPPSLEELEIDHCKAELSEKCRSLATSKLEVKIDGDYVD